MSYPYIEGRLVKGDNAYLVYWNKAGPSAGDWSVDSVKLRGARGQLAAYKVLLRPMKGLEHVQDPQPVGRRLGHPESPLCIVEVAERAVHD